MTTNTNDTREMAYRKAGENWKRKTFRSEAEIDRWFDKHGSAVVETKWAD